MLDCGGGAALSNHPAFTEVTQLATEELTTEEGTDK
jgi:hypothetical protein